MFEKSFQVVSGKIDSRFLAKMIKDGGGSFSPATVQVGKLTFTIKRKGIQLQDANDGTAMGATKAVYQKNGVIHVIDNVVMPGM